MAAGAERPPTRPAAWPHWPLRLDGDDAAALERLLGFAADPLSPLHRLTSESVEGTPLAEEARSRSEAGGPEAIEDLAAALQTLAIPRQLLIVQCAHGDADPLSFYVNDGWRLVRFALSDEDCLAGGRRSHAAFTEAFASWLSAPAVAATGIDHVADRLLRALDGLLGAGLDPADGETPLALDEARAAIAPALSDPGAAPAALGALVEDGVLEAAGDGVRFAAPWVDRHAYLLDPPSLVVHAIDLADAERGMWRPQTLTVLGQRDQRVCVVPAHDEPLGDVLLNLEPLTQGTLAAAMAAVLAAPQTPPVGPVESYDGSPADWLADWVGAGSAPVSLPAWTDERFGPVVPIEEGTPLYALLRPGATVQVTTAPAGPGRAASSVVALTGGLAVEWTMQGSTTRHRALDRAQLGRRLRELLPDGAAEPATGAPVALSPEQGIRLIAGGAQADDGPQALVAAAHDAGAVWRCVRARFLSGTRLAGVVLLVLDSAEHGRWRLEPTPDGFTAAPASPAELRDEVVDALSWRSGPA